MEGNRNCLDCRYYRNSRCMHWNTIVQPALAMDCRAFRTGPATNKGREIWRRSRHNKLVKRSHIKPEQENLVRFVTYKEKVIERINGKYRATNESRPGKGLQIKNRIYLEDGTYKLVNRSTLTIKKIYADIPAWANPSLIEKYNIQLAKRN